MYTLLVCILIMYNRILSLKLKIVKDDCNLLVIILKHIQIPYDFQSSLSHIYS